MSSQSNSTLESRPTVTPRGSLASQTVSDQPSMAARSSSEDQKPVESQAARDSHDPEAPRPKKAIRTSRAAKACEICRKQKTRCFPSQNSPSCLRCMTLGFECSFLISGENVNLQHQQNLHQNSPVPAMSAAVAPSMGFSGNNSHIESSGPFKGPGSKIDVVEKRLGNLEMHLGQLVQLMRNSEGHRLLDASMQSRGSNSLLGSSGRGNEILLINDTIPSAKATFGVPTTPFITSPFNSLGLTMRPEHYPAPLERLKTPQMVFIQQNIITLEYITREQAIEMLDVFLKYYNQWVSFHTGISTEKLLDLMIARSSLLLTVCCCVVIRYHYPKLKPFIWKKLLCKLQDDLKETMLIVPHTIEFIQALVVMSIYASSLSDEDTFVVDAWFISGVALQHLATRNVLGFVLSFDGGLTPVSEIDEIAAYRVWNHLCLVHLVNCVMTGRVCNLDRIRIDQCRKTLDISTSTNFDGRMIAEINFQLILYMYLQANESLNDVEEKLRLWHDDWGYLFEQPTTQFVETGYHYGYFLILYHYNYVANHPEDATDSLAWPPLELTDVATVFSRCSVNHLRRMIRHAIKVIEGLLVVNDITYFKALSDQIHFCGAYAAIMLTRLIETVKTEKKILEISSTLLTKSYNLIGELRDLFNSVSTLPGDVTKKYADSIDEALISCLRVPPAI